jgi:hypothetical protein
MKLKWDKVYDCRNHKSLDYLKSDVGFIDCKWMKLSLYYTYTESISIESIKQGKYLANCLNELVKKGIIEVEAHRGSITGRYIFSKKREIK